MRLPCLTAFFALSFIIPASAAPVTIADNGQAKLEIVISPDAGESVRKAADDLAEYLEKISGAGFEFLEGEGAKGLVLGLPDNLPGLPFPQSFGKDPFERDHYQIISRMDGLYLLGATPQAVEFAVWDLLHVFGYRMYFPSQTWEIIPKRKKLAIDVDRLEKPEFYNRSAPRGGLRRGLRKWAIEEWDQWQVRNRTKSSFVLNTGHAYDGIIKRNKAEFQKHPEYLALRNGIRGGNKFCISNPGLRDLVVRDAIAQIEADPERDSVSLDPSDGGGWCECAPCKEMGTVSDRVILLANQTAEALNQLCKGEKFVGTYAYNEHSPPPSVKVHPNVVVSLATAFIKGDQTFNQMLQGWSAKAKAIGIREYYGLPVWHHSMPGKANAGKPLPLVQTIRDQHASGAKFINAESDDCWGANGLGYYLASRLVWDVDAPVEPIVDEFLRNCFGKAMQPMRAFYEFIGSGPRHSDHMVGTMYRLLAEARGLGEDPQVRKRIDSLILYTRYVELWRKSAGQEGFDRVVEFLWRSRKSIMCDSVGMFWYLNRNAQKDPKRTWIPGQPKSMQLPPERLRVRGDEPFSDGEIQRILDEGIRDHDVLDFKPLEYSAKLVPAMEALGLEETQPLGKAFYGAITRGELHNYTWVDNPPVDIKLEVQIGLIYTSRGPASLTLAHYGAIGVESEGFVEVESARVPEDKQWHPVKFTAQQKGLYRITWDERLSGTRVKWPENLPRTVLSNEGADKQVSGRYSFYFYVPKGTKFIGAYGQARAGGLYDADGQLVMDFNDRGADYLSIPVPKGQDGRLWKAASPSGRLRLMNVPPYVAGRPEDLLLPVEVVEADK